MKKALSLRLRLTLLCAALLTLCCLLLTLTNNLSAVQMADTIQAVPVLPAQDAAGGIDASLPMMDLEASEIVRQARGIFHLQSLLAMAAVLAVGLFLIYRLVGKALPRWTSWPSRSGGVQRKIWSSPWPFRTAGMRWPSWPAPSTRCPGG